MSSFKREVRYTVIKHSQLTDAQIGFLKNCIHGEGIPTVEAVVVESDWSEFEPVWKMIEDRIAGAPVVERQPTPWSYCPECGCEELHHEQGEHKQCANCRQEWFSDIDYSEVVRGNLEKLKSLSR